jgi:hypothetical protein
MGRRREGEAGDKAGEGGKEDRRTRGPEDWRITKIQVAGSDGHASFRHPATRGRHLPPENA